MYRPTLVCRFGRRWWGNIDSFLVVAWYKLLYFSKILTFCCFYAIVQVLVAVGLPPESVRARPAVINIGC